MLANKYPAIVIKMAQKVCEKNCLLCNRMFLLCSNKDLSKKSVQILSKDNSYPNNRKKWPDDVSVHEEEQEQMQQFIERN